MRFHGLTEKSRSGSFVKMMREQRVFDSSSGAVSRPMVETMIGFSGPSYLRLDDSETIVENYFRHFSTERQEINWKLLLGVETTRFEFNKEKFFAEFKEVSDRASDGRGAELTWHDISIFLLALRITSPEKVSSFGLSVKDILESSVRKNDENQLRSFVIDILRGLVAASKKFADSALWLVVPLNRWPSSMMKL